MQKKHIYIFFLVTGLTIYNCFSQEEALIVTKDTIVSSTNIDNSRQYNPLSPSKAAFYSAILPGLGQAYNKKYWKIPIVYGALGTGIYFYDRNHKNYNRFRDAYKLSLDGKPHEFDGQNGNILLPKETLERAQKTFKKDRDLSLLVTVGLYILQIVEASTNAHLLQHNVDNNLSVNPQLIKDITTNKTIVGASFNFKF